MPWRATRSEPLLTNDVAPRCQQRKFPIQAPVLSMVVHHRRSRGSKGKGASSAPKATTDTHHEHATSLEPETNVPASVQLPSIELARVGAVPIACMLASKLMGKATVDPGSPHTLAGQASATANNRSGLPWSYLKRDAIRSYKIPSVTGESLFPHGGYRQL